MAEYILAVFWCYEWKMRNLHLCKTPFNLGSHCPPQSNAINLCLCKPPEFYIHTALFVHWCLDPEKSMDADGISPVVVKKYTLELPSVLCKGFHWPLLYFSTFFLDLLTCSSSYENGWSFISMEHLYSWNFCFASISCISISKAFDKVSLCNNQSIDAVRKLI